MRARAAMRTVTAILTVILLVLLAASAHAENWVRVVEAGPTEDDTFVNIDTDSIRRGADGLVYFDAEEDMGVSPTAVSCEERKYYVVGDGTLDHMNHPYPIKPGSPEAAEADFVCGRA